MEKVTGSMDQNEVMYAGLGLPAQKKPFILEMQPTSYNWLPAG